MESRDEQILRVLNDIKRSLLILSIELGCAIAVIALISILRD